MMKYAAAQGYSVKKCDATMLNTYSVARLILKYKTKITLHEVQAVY